VLSNSVFPSDNVLCYYTEKVISFFSLRYGGIRCLHLQDDWIRITWMVKWLQRGNVGRLQIFWPIRATEEERGQILHRAMNWNPSWEITRLVKTYPARTRIFISVFTANRSWVLFLQCIKTLKYIKGTLLLLLLLLLLRLLQILHLIPSGLFQDTINFKSYATYKHTPRPFGWYYHSSQGVYPHWTTQTEKMLTHICLPS